MREVVKQQLPNEIQENGAQDLLNEATRGGGLFPLHPSANHLSMHTLYHNTFYCLQYPQQQSFLVYNTSIISPSSYPATIMEPPVWTSMPNTQIRTAVTSSIQTIKMKQK